MSIDPVEDIFSNIKNINIKNGEPELECRFQLDERTYGKKYDRRSE